jgi:hypoxanthine-DNA glycosylase
MGALCGAGPKLPYEQRLERLQAAGIALWDVFASCAREGSLDASIEQASAVVNDIPALLQRCPQIIRICCNGTTSYTALKRHLGAELERVRPAARLERLPSTSPANASWSVQRKLEAWRAALERAGARRPGALAATSRSSSARPARARRRLSCA